MSLAKANVNVLFLGRALVKLCQHDGDHRGIITKTKFICKELVQGSSKTPTVPSQHLSLWEWTQAGACWALGWQVKVSEMNKGQAEEKGLPHIPAPSHHLKSWTVPCIPPVRPLYQVQSPHTIIFVRKTGTPSHIWHSQKYSDF